MSNYTTNETTNMVGHNHKMENYSEFWFHLTEFGVYAIRENHETGKHQLINDHGNVVEIYPHITHGRIILVILSELITDELRAKAH
ncbi:MAG: hypothetical protein V3U78_04685 [Thiotrichaceae bacterium]